MEGFLLFLLLGLPAYLFSLIISIVGIVAFKHYYLIIGGISITGFGWIYLAGSPDQF